MRMCILESDRDVIAIRSITNGAQPKWGCVKDRPMLNSLAVKATRIPESAMKYFRLTGSLGGKKRAKLYSKEQLREWGKRGGRPKANTTNKEKE